MSQRIGVGGISRKRAAGAFQPVDHTWSAGLVVKAGQIVEHDGTLYKVDADMTLPGSFDTTGLTSVGGGGGTSSPVALNDFARWERTGAVDVTTGSWDFEVDLASSDGTTIVADASTEFVTDWGNALPKVTEDGTYLIAATIYPDAAERASLGVGSLVGNAPDFLHDGPPLGLITAKSPAAGEPASLCFTTWLQADTHIGLNTDTGAADPASMMLVIQRVA